MIDLEERLRRAADLLDQQAVEVPLALAPSRRASPDVAGRRAAWLTRVAAAVVLAIGLVGLGWALSRGPGAGPAPGTQPAATDVPTATTPAAAVLSTPETSTPARLTFAPVATLPLFADLIDAPVTIAASEPTNWYRLQPDLDVAWYDNGRDGSMLCFRSPSVTPGCQSDEAMPVELGGGPIAVQGGDGQFLIVVIGGTGSGVVSVTLDDGTVATANAEKDPQIGWWVARIPVAAGRRPAGMSMSFLADRVEGPGMSVAPTTAPPASVPETTAAATVPPLTSPPTTPPG